MIRESLDPGARNLMFARAQNGSLWRSHRPSADGPTIQPSQPLRSQTAPKRPLVLRLTRRGDTIQLEYSEDEGQRFQSGGAVTFDSPLSGVLYVGVGSTATDRTKLSEAKFDVPVIKEL
jgi:hypothetical protein